MTQFQKHVCYINAEQRLNVSCSLPGNVTKLKKKKGCPRTSHIYPRCAINVTLESYFTSQQNSKLHLLRTRMITSHNYHPSSQHSSLKSILMLSSYIFIGLFKRTFPRKFPPFILRTWSALCRCLSCHYPNTTAWSI